MSLPSDDVIVRDLTEDDLPALIDLQEAGAVVGLATVFPPDRYPFPRDAIVARWRDEIRDAAIDTYVAVDDQRRLVGFAAVNGARNSNFPPYPLLLEYALDASTSLSTSPE